MAGKNKEQRGKGGQNQQQREQGAGQSREGGGQGPQNVRQPAQEAGKPRPDERPR